MTLLKSCKNLDKLFDEVMTKTAQVVEKSREDIYQIGETARQEHQRIKQQLVVVQKEVAIIIERVDNLKKQYRQARMYLMVVNRDFNKYTQQEVQDAYFQASQLQEQIAVYEEREKFLRIQRDHLEINCHKLESMVERSQELNSNINLALKFLTNDWQEINNFIGQLQQRQALGISVIKAQEEERKRVARDIHDGPAQSMANIIMRAELCLKLLESDRDMAKEELTILVDLVRHGLADVRKIIFDLRPMVLDDLGLIPALKHYFEQWERSNGVHLEVVILGPERRLQSGLEICLFRIIQESLSNIIKHAGATMVLIKIEFSNDQINLVIRDNGKGFDVKRSFNNDDNTCFGLIGMQERVQLLNGNFEVKSKIGRGTELFINLPFK